MDLLDLHRFLFSRIAAGERFDERVCAGRKRGDAFARPDIPHHSFACLAGRCRGAEPHWAEHWEVAAECGWRGNVFAAFDVGGRGSACLSPAWLGDAFYRREYDADVELGHGELLVADRICVFRARTSLRNERRSA